jgi:hypothetical protein
VDDVSHSLDDIRNAFSDVRNAVGDAGFLPAGALNNNKQVEMWNLGIITLDLTW